MTGTTPLWLGVATPAVALVAAIFTLIGVRVTIRAAERRRRDEAKDSLALTHEQARLTAEQMAHDADRRSQEHARFLYALPRQEAYVEFLTATSAFTLTVTTHDGEDADQYERAVREANEPVWAAIAKISLLSPSPVVRAAEDYWRLLTRNLRKTRSVSNEDAKKLRSAFIQAAREDLSHGIESVSGIHGGGVTRPSRDDTNG